MKTIYETVCDLRETYQKTDLNLLLQRITDLEKRVENLENENHNLKAEIRNNKWEALYQSMGLYNYGEI